MRKLVIGAAIAVIFAPTLAFAQTPTPAETAAALAVCNTIPLRQIEIRRGEELDACWNAGLAALDAAGALTVAEQEAVGMAFAGVLREAAPGPLPFGTIVPAVQVLSELLAISAYRECWTRIERVSTLEGCSATVRIVTIAAQAIPDGNIEGVANNICIASQARPAWQPVVLTIVDELIARAGTGTDPVMRGRIDRVAVVRATCGIVTT